MKIVLFGLIATSFACSAQAQMQGQASTATMPAGLVGNTASAGSRLPAYGYNDGFVRGTLETPTMRRQKLAQAIALRDEALALQASDGGSLTDSHVRQIQRKSRAILSYTLTSPGALAPIRP